MPYPVQSLTEVFDNLYTTTWQNMKDTLVDNIFSATPFWYWLRDKGKMKTEQGGRFLTEPIVFDKSDNVKWTGKGGTMPMNDKQILTLAKYDWRYLAGSIVRFGVDDQQNRGKNEILSFMNAKLENLKLALITELEIRLFGGSGATSAGTTTEDYPAFDGLQTLVADDPTASASVGGIPQDTNTWWRNQSVDMNTLSFATFGVSKMRTMLNNCMNNQKMDQPDILISDQSSYEFYEDVVLSHFRTQNLKLADAGFQNQVFKGIPWVWSPSCTQRIYFLNTRFINFVYDPMMFFDMTEWKPIPNQINDRTAQTITACALTTSRRKVMGVLKNVNTA